MGKGSGPLRSQQHSSLLSSARFLSDMLRAFRSRVTCCYRHILSKQVACVVIDVMLCPTKAFLVAFGVAGIIAEFGLSACRFVLRWDQAFAGTHV